MVLYYDVRGEGKMRQARIYRGVMYDTSCNRAHTDKYRCARQECGKTILAVQRLLRQVKSVMDVSS